MRARDILLLAAALLASVTEPASSNLANTASFGTLQSVPAQGDGKRFLRIHKTADEDDQAERGDEERAIPALKQFSDRLEALVNNKKRLEKLYRSGAANEVLYKEKIDPSFIYSRLDIASKVTSLSKAELKNDVPYQRWANYFDYWVNRNSGKIRAPV